MHVVGQFNIHYFQGQIQGASVPFQKICIFIMKMSFNDNFYYNHPGVHVHTYIKVTITGTYIQLLEIMHMPSFIRSYALKPT